MDFSFTEEQELLRESIRRLVAYAADGGAAAQDAWRAMAEAGLLAMPFAEEDGGLGDAAVETLILMEAFGRGLVRAPYLATVVLAGGLICHAGSAAQRAELIPSIGSGEMRLAFAFAEPDGRYNSAHVRVRARRTGGVYHVSGVKTAVLGGGSADRLCVSVRTAGGDDEPDGVTVLLVDPNSGGVTRETYRTIDGQEAATVRFDEATVPVSDTLGAPDGALPLIERVLDAATAAICAEAVGALSALNALTLDYCKTRVAFGQPIGRFQAVQHQLVDMRLAEEQAASMAILAALSLDEAAPARARAVSAAKAKIGAAARFVRHGAVQLHGGVGVTDELAVGRYFKRLMAIEAMFGDAEHHTRRFAELRP